MRYIYDHDLHIHSSISLCSNDPLQSAERILQYAKDNGLKKICVTDHFWDEDVPGASEWYKKQNYEWISNILPLPTAEGIQFLFGAETEMNKDTVVAITPKSYDKFDFIVVPTTHLNNPGVGLTVEEGQSVEGRARAWLRKLKALLYMELPYHKLGIAHLACSLIAKEKADRLAVLDLLPEEELRVLFKRAAELGVGIELNSSDMNFQESEAKTVLRVFEIAKSCGCKFYFGSDAHHPHAFEKAPKVFERAIDYLELKESDKFDFCKL